MDENIVKGKVGLRKEFREYRPPSGVPRRGEGPARARNPWSGLSSDSRQTKPVRGDAARDTGKPVRKSVKTRRYCLGLDLKEQGEASVAATEMPDPMFREEQVNLPDCCLLFRFPEEGRPPQVISLDVSSRPWREDEVASRIASGDLDPQLFRIILQATLRLDNLSRLAKERPSGDPGRVRASFPQNKEIPPLRRTLVRIERGEIVSTEDLPEDVSVLPPDRIHAWIGGPDFDSKRLREVLVASVNRLERVASKGEER